MKRHGDLFEKLITFENLYYAFRKAFKGSGRSEEACCYSFDLERNLFSLRDELVQAEYQPGTYRYFKVYEPKERTISVAPFRDRVVHHAIVNVLEPIYEKCFIYDSYATRKGKGTHRAVSRAQSFMRSAGYYLKFDIDKYFDNICHDRLLAIIQRKVKGRKLIELLSRIIVNSDISRRLVSGRGLPIGNLTSQFFANVYLDSFDHYIKERLRIRQYIRYMDDCVIFHNDKRQLLEILRMSEHYLTNSLGLTLKHKATFLNTRSNGLPFLGYRIFPSLIRLKQDNIRRLKRKLRLREKEFLHGIISEETYAMSLSSLAGYAGFADSLHLRRELLH